MSAEPRSASDSQSKPPGWYERQKSAERMKLAGVLALAVILLLMAFLRFGRTIPWGAR